MYTLRHRLVRSVFFRVFGSLALVIVGMARPAVGQAPEPPLEMLIPMYIYPSSVNDYQAWRDVAAARAAIPITVIVNPNSGPTPVPNSDYDFATQLLRDHDVTMIGYIATGYGAKDLAAAKAEADLYAQNWTANGLTGVFLDEVSASLGDLAYYDELCGYIKTQTALDKVFLNPGVDPPAAYLTDTLCDVAVRFEESLATWDTRPFTDYDPALDGRFAALVQNVPDAATMHRVLDEAIERGITFLYITHEIAPAGWDELPTFWQEEIDVMARHNGTPAITSPNGGEAWTAGTTEPITWTDGLTENVQIQLLKGGVFDRTIAASTDSDGSFDYAVPAALAPGTDYTVRVRSVEEVAVADVSDMDFEVRASVVVTSPAPGTVWPAGTIQNITWTDNLADDVRILLFKGGVFARTIEVATPSDGFIFFPIPSDLAPGTDYTVRVRSVADATVRDDSDPFEISTGETVSVTGPGGGEVWAAGTTHPIAWADNFAENVRIFLFKDGGYFRTIAASTPSDGAFDWTIPPGLPPGTTYAIRVRKTDNYLVRGDSDGFFEITAPMPGPRLAAPVLAAAPSGGVVRWLPVEGAAGYRVEVASDSTFARVTAADLDAMTLSYGIADAAAAVRVRAYAGAAVSPWRVIGRVAEGAVSFRLDANYPNPFHGATTIRYVLAEAAPVRLAVYDVLGREVALLVEARQIPGVHTTTFDAAGLPSGVYVYRLRAGGRTAIGRMSLLH